VEVEVNMITKMVIEMPIEIRETLMLQDEKETGPPIK
jgi:hypothetical protein